MLYLGDYLELIEHLPQELRYKLTEMRQLDLQVHNTTDRLDDETKNFFKTCERLHDGPKRQQEFNRIVGEYCEAVKYVDEKVQIAQQMYDLVERLARRLDGELTKFKLELEADHAGITDELEARSYELDTPLMIDNSQQQSPPATPSIQQSSKRQRNVSNCGSKAGKAGKAGKSSSKLKSSSTSTSSGLASGKRRSSYQHHQRITSASQSTSTSPRTSIVDEYDYVNEDDIDDDDKVNDNDRFHHNMFQQSRQRYNNNSKRPNVFNINSQMANARARIRNRVSVTNVQLTSNHKATGGKSNNSGPGSIVVNESIHCPDLGNEILGALSSEFSSSSPNHRRNNNKVCGKLSPQSKTNNDQMMTKNQKHSALSAVLGSTPHQNSSEIHQQYQLSNNNHQPSSFSALINGNQVTQSNGSTSPDTSTMLGVHGNSFNAQDPIVAAASQAIAATQQMQVGRRTSSLKASYAAINNGLGSTLDFPSKDNHNSNNNQQRNQKSHGAGKSLGTNLNSNYGQQQSVPPLYISVTKSGRMTKRPRHTLSYYRDDSPLSHHHFSPHYHSQQNQNNSNSTTSNQHHWNHSNSNNVQYSSNNWKQRSNHSDEPIYNDDLDGQDEFNSYNRNNYSSLNNSNDQNDDSKDYDEQSSGGGGKISFNQQISYQKDDTKYCICRRVSYGNMVACDNVECEYEWFHYGCVGITQPPKGKWFCPDCAKKSSQISVSTADLNSNSAFLNSTTGTSGGGSGNYRKRGRKPSQIKSSFSINSNSNSNFNVNSSLYNLNLNQDGTDQSSQSNIDKLINDLDTTPPTTATTINTDDSEDTSQEQHSIQHTIIVGGRQNQTQKISNFEKY